MDLSKLLSLDAINLSCDAESMKQAFCCIARQACETNGKLNRNDIIAALVDRERLGSTGIGGGIALPHARLAGLSVEKAIFLRLDKPVDFDALDDQPVDIICALLVPEDACQDQKKCLAKLARLLRDAKVSERIRHAATKEAVHAVLSQALSQHASGGSGTGQGSAASLSASAANVAA